MNSKVMGAVNYLDGSVTPSLYRNGKVLTRRDPDGSDGGTVGVDGVTQVVPIADGRTAQAAGLINLQQSGFEVRPAPLADPAIDFLDHNTVVRRYYPDCEQLLAQVTGARVVAFDHNVRSATGKAARRRIEGGQLVQGPAHMVHGDYTLTSAPQRLRDLALPPGVNDALRGVLAPGEALLDASQVAGLLDGGRFAIINVWRSFGPDPVARDALALCDGRSVQPDDLVVFEIHYHDRVGENYFARPSATHAWYTFPAMTRDEVMFIKQWDSAGELSRSGGSRPDGEAADSPCTFSFHTAYRTQEDDAAAPERLSIEVRCVVAYGSTAEETT